MPDRHDTVGFRCRCGASTIVAHGYSGRSSRAALCPACAERRLRTICISAALRLLVLARGVGEAGGDDDAPGSIAGELRELAEEIAAAGGAEGEALR